MTSLLHTASTAEESLIAEFFRRSQGQWRSERRYYTLPEGDTQEGLTLITIRFLEPECPELVELADRHQLPKDTLLTCGAYIHWDSQNPESGRRTSRGKTVFGALGATLYRDRGFATVKPVTAAYHCPNSDTLCLRTEYDGSVFEEEIKLIGQNYRTRQTIISRAGEQTMIGQYLEKRLQD